MPTTEPVQGAPIVLYSPTEAEIAKVASEYAELVADPDSYRTHPERVKSALQLLVSMRGTIERTRQDYKRDSLLYGRRVDAEAKRLTALVKATEQPLAAQKEAAEAEARKRADAIVRAQEEKDALERKARPRPTDADRIRVIPLEIRHLLSDTLFDIGSYATENQAFVLCVVAHLQAIADRCKTYTGADR